MNSEELEQSLRSEFETYLNSVLADLRQESAEFQNKIQAEFERHREQFDEAFGAISARFDSTPGFNEAFNSAVAEHLKLARDEGAKLAANAMVEAEKLDDMPEAAAHRYDAIRDAVNEISSKDSQSAILKSLVHHASEFAPRGAFFIIKSNHFAGWKVLGTDDELEKTVREVHFPVSRDTILSAAVESRSTVEGYAGKHADDGGFLDPLAFGQPERMMALPLVARGRGVAVMYVDSGDSGGEINREALETLIKVAGITVELLASTQTAAEENRTMAPADFENARHDQTETAAMLASFESGYSTPAAEAPEPSAAYEPSGFSFSESSPSETEYSPEPEQQPAPEYGSSFSEPISENAPPAESDFASQFESTIPSLNEFERPAAPDFEQPTSFSEPQHTAFDAEYQPQPAPDTEFTYGTQEPSVDDIRNAPSEFPTADSSEFGTPAAEFDPSAAYGQPSQFDTGGSIEPAAAASSPFDRAVEEYQPSGASAGNAYTPAPEPIVPAPAPSAPQSRFSDRPVDLPIDVPEDERRLHNDARRFARLLVSEIKLYNEKKVIEGKQAHDLYERLREAIDRSREMYDKRVQPPVASKFDYFHYELLNSLADGSVERLGEGYPGASI